MASTLSSVIGALRVNLELDSAKYVEGTKKVSNSSAKMKKDLDGLSKPVNNLNNMLGVFKAGAIGFVTGLVAGGVAEIGNQIRTVVTSIAAVGDEAKRAGLGVGEFQEWKFVAEQNRIGIDAVVDGFKELNLRADEFIVTGGGSAAEAFKRLGFTGKTLAEALKDPSELMLTIIDRLHGMDTAAQIRIADEIFGGTGGEQFVQLLGLGRTEIEKIIATAHETGAVMDNEMIVKAQKLDAEWKRLTASVAGYGKQVALAAADLPSDLVNTRLNEIFDEDEGRSILGDAMYDQLVEQRNLTDEQVEQLSLMKSEYSQLSDSVSVFANELGQAASEADMLGNDALWSVFANASNDLRDLKTKFDEGKISAEEFRTGVIDIKSGVDEGISTLEDVDKIQFTNIISRLGAVGVAVNSVTTLANAMYNALSKGQGLTPKGGFQPDMNRFGNPYAHLEVETYAPETSTKPKERPFELGVPELDTGGGGGGGGGESKESKFISRLRKEVEKYRATVEMTALEEEIWQNKREAGVFGDAQGEAMIESLTRDKHAFEKLKDQMKETEDAIKSMKESFADTFSSILLGAESGKEAIAGLLKQMAETMMNNAFMTFFNSLGSGGGGGWLGGFARMAFGSVGANANGTSGWRGGLTMVGERGPELVNLRSGAQVYTNRETQKLMSGGSQKVELVVGYSKDTEVRVLNEANNNAVKISKQQVNHFKDKELAHSIKNYTNNQKRR